MEDGWVATDNPNSSGSGGINQKKAETMDIDDIDNVIDGGDESEQQQEAVDIDEIDNN